MLLDICLAHAEITAAVCIGGRRMAMRQLLFVRDRNFLILLLLLWLLVWVSAARSADQIRVGYGSLSTSYAAIWVAGEASLFRKNGINAEVLYLESALVRTALIAGDIAMGGMSGTTMAAPRLQGADPVIIASFANALQYRLVVRPDIRTVADLKSKRVGVAGFGLGAHRGAQIILAKLGLNPDTDVTMLQIGGAGGFAERHHRCLCVQPAAIPAGRGSRHESPGEHRRNEFSGSGIRPGYHRSIYQEESRPDAALDEIHCPIDPSDKDEPRADQARAIKKY